MRRHDIAFGAAVSFLAGIVAASFGWNILIVSGLVLLASIAFLFFFRTQRPLRFLPLFVFVVFAGIFYYHLYLNLEERGRIMTFGEQVEFRGVIIDEPREFEKYQTLEVVLKPPFHGTIKILTSASGDFRYGEIITAKGRIEPPASIADMPVSAFPEITALPGREGLWLKEKLIDFKSLLVEGFRKNLDADEAALLTGMTFGSQSANFSNDFKTAMNLSGTTHLVALSGYNISILISAVACVFGYFISRRKTFYLTVAVIALFVLMVGTEASVVRAAIMGFLALAAKEIGRIYSVRNAIALTASLMAIAEPRLLIYDVAFQLSFLSLLGIIYLGPAIKKLLRAEKDASGLKEIIVLTLSAQLAVLPLIMKTFGRFSLTAVLANTMILGFIPWTMAFGFILAALNLLPFQLGFLAAKLAGLLLRYEIGVINFFGGIGLTLTPPAWGRWLIVLIYYGMLIALMHRFSADKSPIKNEKEKL